MTSLEKCCVSVLLALKLEFISIPYSVSVKIHTFSDANMTRRVYTLLVFMLMFIPRSATFLLGYHATRSENMNTTVAEWPFWVKALCNNKQLLAPRSCFPAADQCQNTELTAIPFTAVEKHQPSKPTYLQRLWTACNPSAARWLLETLRLSLLPEKLLHSYSVASI